MTTAKVCMEIALLSNYSWVYNSLMAAKKHFPRANITLITKNTPDILKTYDFGVKVIEQASAELPGGMVFDAIAIDNGFNLNAVALACLLRYRKLFLVETAGTGNVREIGRLGFAILTIKKAPYFINRALIQLSKKFRMSVSIGRPSELYIETTSVCNLKCKACPTGLGQLTRPAILMSEDIFTGIVNRNRRNFKYVEVVYPFLFGEPLLNKDIFKFLKEFRAVSRPYTRVELHTNGSFSNSTELAGKILEADIDMISVSLDGADKETYDNFRQGGNFHHVSDFIRSLAEGKKRLSLTRPEIVMQMVVTKYTESQVEAYKKLKEKLGADRILFKEYFYEFTNMADADGIALAPSNDDLAFGDDKKKASINKKKNLCGWPYRAVAIMTNGKMAPCCIDFDGNLLDGLALDGGRINRAWNSRKYRKFRKDMVRGKVAMCNKCFMS